MAGPRRGAPTRARGRAPGPSRTGPPRTSAERHLGRVEASRGRIVFVPARRIGHGRRPLVVPPGLSPEPGDVVIAELHPDADHATLVEVLGADDDPRFDDLGVASRHRLPQAFSAAAEAEAKSFGPPRLDPSSGRLDLRDRACFTMDPADAKDFDDALSWRPLPDGGCEVGIHIADVAWYVRDGSALDAEARDRATSVYLSGGVIPMLPHALSSDLCSLVPDKPRYAMSVLAEMDARGGVTHYRLAEGLIESRARLSYEQGQAILDGDRGARRAVPEEVVRGLTEIAALAARLRERRFRRGALDLDVPETKALVDEKGNVLDIVRRPRLVTMTVIEEFMLLANLLVGEEGERREGPFLYRVHEAPSLSKLAALEQMLGALGLPRLSAAAGVAQALQALLATPLPPDRRRLLHTLVLRSLARAQYREADVGHFGLAARAYCHFTSPIRRYPDLYNHRQVKGWLDAATGAPKGLDDDAMVAAVALNSSGREQKAQEAERESTRVKSLRFVADRLGEEHEGTITGVVPAGVFVELEEIPVDGFLRVSSWVDDDFRMDEAGVRLVGRRSRRKFSLGDRLTVRLARVDIPARELELALEPPRSGRGKGRPAAGRRKGGGPGRRKQETTQAAGSGRGRSTKERRTR
jgi:ribonuclease R